MRPLSVVLIAAAVLTTISPASAPAADRDCSDFATHNEAQTFFERHQPGDPHRLDRNGDGVACESLLSSASSGPSTPDYRREAYMPHGWQDIDQDGEDMRAEILAAQRTGDVWHGPYTGRVFHDAGALHIDHLVPLCEAHQSGAADWPARRKRRFAHWRPNLIAVEAGANMSKGCDGPADWLPPRRSSHCAYIRQWQRVKRHWGLSSDPRERRTIERILKQCDE